MPDIGSDPAVGTREGIRTVWIALAALALTTLAQVVIVALSGSVALLADTVHNLGDFLNSVPLLLAFYLSRRVATRRYTYGFGRAEDIAGIVIVASIVFSAVYIFWESFQKLLSPEPISQLPWVALAAVLGFAGNEAVAMFQIRTGKRIGSAALIADGQHARIDGLTSLVVLVAVFGSWAGYPVIDPIIGMLIGVAILFIARDATLRVWHRLMDAVDPTLIDQIEQYAGDVAGVDEVVSIRARWVGHSIHAEVVVAVHPDETVERIYEVVGKIRHELYSYIRHLTVVNIETIPTTMQLASSTFNRAKSVNILPPRYQDPNTKVSAAPMGAAALAYDDDGEVAWGEMWEGFCELALAGGAPHRGVLLEPVHEDAIAINPERQEWVLKELERGIGLVTGLPVVRSVTPGWIGMECHSEEMALWLLRAIVVENITVRREDAVLWFPAGPDFRLEREIKSVITVVAKTNHYWDEHVAGQTVAARR